MPAVKTLIPYVKCQKISGGALPGLAYTPQPWGEGHPLLKPYCIGAYNASILVQWQISLRMPCENIFSHITSLKDIKQSLPDFFNLVDLRLTLTLLYDSLNLVIRGFQRWTPVRGPYSSGEMKLRVRAVSIEMCCAWVMSRCSVLLKDKISPATCLIAANTCWDSTASQ